LTIDLPDESATRAFSRALAGLAREGDVFALEGDLGTGKTVFARTFIRALTHPAEEVPSPSFTLVQGYESSAGTIHHFDLYRLTVPEEALELGIEEAFASGITLIEWPARLGPLLPASALTITLHYGPHPDARRAVVTGPAAWRPRLSEAGIG
jgi:tRNA threonylcarbamoyladenosine biosynthesis protein TsaE